MDKHEMNIRIVKKLVAAGLVMLAVGGSYGFADSFVGVNHGPYHKPGQSPDQQTSIPDSQFQSDLSYAPCLLNTVGSNEDIPL
jgi:hypothetical protein